MDLGSLAFVLIVFATTIWVYVDACAHKIGRTTRRGFWNLDAVGWGFLCILLWIVFFPAYLFKRKKLIELAEVEPIEQKYKVPYGIALVICGTLMLAKGFIG